MTHVDKYAYVYKYDKIYIIDYSIGIVYRIYCILYMLNSLEDIDVDSLDYG